MGYAQLVIGPAGSGKSTYCSSLYQHCEANRRTIHIVNLDPAAENFNYPVAVGGSVQHGELLPTGLKKGGLSLSCAHIHVHDSTRVLSQIDNCIQYGEDVKFGDFDREEE
ncbi:hypothetical protein LguiB_000567 [Lonicera macranthoides]